MLVADVFFGQKLHGIFHSGIKLLADQFVAGLCAMQFLYGCRISLLGAVGVEPQSFDGFIQCFLFVEQSQLTGLILKFGFFYGTFGLSVVKDWDADAESDGVVPSVFTCSPKVKSLPLVWLVPIPAVRLTLGRYPDLAIPIPSSDASTLSLLASISGRRATAERKTSVLVGGATVHFRHPMQADRPAFPVRRPVRGVASVATYSPEVWPVRSPVDNGRC
mgnify:CR=1 FL=1